MNVHAVLIEGANKADNTMTYKIIHVKHPGMSWDLVKNDWTPEQGSTFKSRAQAVKAIEHCAIPDAQVRRRPHIAPVFNYKIPVQPVRKRKRNS